MIEEGIGFGKVILFNEHFVVYNVPAIASAIGMKTSVSIEPAEKLILIDDRKETPGYKKEKLEQQKESLKRIMDAADIENRDIKIALGGDLIASSGIGASAASCVAIARALSEYFNLDFSDNRINDLAYEGEKGYHGTPSGIDNTVATYGGLVWFKKSKPNIIERLNIQSHVEIVITNTGIVADTSRVVAGVRERKNRNPEKYKRIFNNAEKLVYDAREALKKFDLKKVGELMNKNHKLLQEIGVSCKELDFLVDLARDNGAYGAKLTGGGAGGNMVALTPGKELQENVVSAMEKEGFTILRTTIG
ncbi:MAG: mevalonate kinase [Candidatus Thermoplasmatota archaeon]|nr:mevalonate kinase [archaeon]MBU4190474.1 mevalonate kinase [Candidatus Thermoplasmatota archaeon]MBU4256416.1 mevalonate kinase [Candidatus Thermoplasmatota archaeon]MCG2826242.1 mevalonate kinase [Thermoplasmatales archaeon]